MFSLALAPNLLIAGLPPFSIIALPPLGTPATLWAFTLHIYSRLVWDDLNPTPRECSTRLSHAQRTIIEAGHAHGRAVPFGFCQRSIPTISRTGFNPDVGGALGCPDASIPTRTAALLGYTTAPCGTAGSLTRASGVESPSVLAASFRERECRRWDSNPDARGAST